ncbi:pleckstrin homology domain-containing family A member 4-like isoform X4 [Grus americana]|uniref:pleckstrin homology domain-containing family A member 4-like isoform X4 n=1 Tax=Grus americana TaxID=9117 RepID=UPI0024083202|nr:pleckstrin homology domain-containing family A member 4-like isoform X4 [Grus americana]
MADGEEPPRQAPAGPRGPGTQPCRPVPRVHAFGKGGQALRRDPRAPPAMRGWLHKQDSSGLRLWKRRWFVLVDLCLYYYRDSGEQRVRGGLPLPGYEIRVLPLAPRAPRFLFTAEHPGMRTYCLGAETPEELNAWVCALRRGASPLPGRRPRPGRGPVGRWTPGGSRGDPPWAPLPPQQKLRLPGATTNQQLPPLDGRGPDTEEEDVATNQTLSSPSGSSDWLLASEGSDGALPSSGNASPPAANETSLWPRAGASGRGLKREGVAGHGARRPIRITLLQASF